MNIKDDVILIGTRSDVNIIMSAFDVFLLPSLHEGLPVTLVESMANGLSYIIEKKVVAEEMSKYSNCIAVNGYDIDNWVNAIVKVQKIGRFDSEECINLLCDYSAEHFKNIIEELYS